MMRIMKKPLGKKILVGTLIVVAAYLTLLIFTSHLKAYKMDGPSMIPTIENGEKVKAKVVPASEVKHGDIIVFSKSLGGEERRMIKRVVGLPGDTVEIANGELIVTKPDGSTYKPYNDSNTTLNGKAVVGPNSFYVVGDNRTNSLDSRFGDFGQIPFSDLQSVVTNQ